MSIKKALILSVSIPMASFPFVVSSHAAVTAARADGPILLARSDKDDDAPDQRRRHDHDKGSKAEKKDHGQQGDKTERHDEKRPEKAAPKPEAEHHRDRQGTAGDKVAPPAKAAEKPDSKNHTNARPEPKAEQAPAPQSGKSDERHSGNGRDRHSSGDNDHRPGSSNDAASKADHTPDARHRAQDHGNAQDHEKKPTPPAVKKAPSPADTPQQASPAEKSSKTPAPTPTAKGGETGKPASPTAEQKRGDHDHDTPRPGDKQGQHADQNGAGQNGAGKPGNQPKNAGNDDQGQRRRHADDNDRHGSPQKGDHAKLPDEPTRNQAAPAAANAKPQRLDVPNGAPVFDSAKEDRHGHDRDRNGSDRDRNRNGSDQDRQDNARRDNGRHDQGDRQAADNRPRKPVHVRSAEDAHGKRIDHAPQFALPSDAHVDDRSHGRVILNIDNRTIIENTDHDRISHDARDVRYESLSDGNTRQVIVRPNGVRVVTIRNRYGDIIHRSRIGDDGNETVLIYVPQDDRRNDDFYRDSDVDLPPLRLDEPVDDYILDARHADQRQYIRFLEKPPIERVSRVYSLNQVRYSARLRDIMPRIDLDTITFATGSSDIGSDQAQALGELADAVKTVLADDPGQIFLIEGHTDAVGSAQSNLILSDERAESVASTLTQDFDVPPENLVTQGYGEEYLKVKTDGAERLNRRVAVRRITPLVRPEISRN